MPIFAGSNSGSLLTHRPSFQTPHFSSLHSALICPLKPGLISPLLQTPIRLLQALGVEVVEVVGVVEVLDSRASIKMKLLCQQLKYSL